MRTYYHGQDAVVTEKFFARPGRTAEIRYSIDELDDLRVDHASVGGPSGAELMLGLLLVGITVVTGLKFSPVAALPVAVALAVLLAAWLRGRSGRGSVIRARYRAQEIVLYTSTDARVFNQVARALRRAIERRAVRRSWLVAG